MGRNIGEQTSRFLRIADDHLNFHRSFTSRARSKLTLCLAERTSERTNVPDVFIGLRGSLRNDCLVTPPIPSKWQSHGLNPRTVPDVRRNSPSFNDRVAREIAPWTRATSQRFNRAPMIQTGLPCVAENVPFDGSFRLNLRGKLDFLIGYKVKR